MAGEKTIKLKITGDSTAVAPATASAGRSVQKLQKAVDVASIAILASTVAIGVGLLKVADEFDSAYDKIRIKTGANIQQMAGLEKSFDNVAKSVPNTFNEISTAVAGVNQLTGASGARLEGLSRQYLDLSRIIGVEVGSAVDLGTKVMKAWNVTLEQQPATLDKLFRASQASGLGFDRLAERVQTFAPVLRNAGFDLDRSVALIASLEKSGANTEKVIGALSIGAGKLAKDGKDLAKGLALAIDQISKAPTASRAAQIAVEAFGAKAGPQLADAIRQGQLSIGDLYNAIASGKDTIAGVADQTDDWKEALGVLKNNIAVELKPVAMSLFNFLNEKAIPALKGTWEWTKKNKDVIKPLVVTILAFSGGVLTLNAGLRAYSAIASAVRVVTWGWAAAQDALNIAMAANPIGLFLIGIGLIITGFVLLWNNSKEFRDFWKGLWQGIKDVAAGFGRWFSETLPNFFSRAWQGIKSGFKSAINWVIDKLNWFVRQYNKLDLSIPGITGDAFPDISEIPRLARGGVARRGRPVLVGEEGPEVFTPGRTGRVTSHEDSRALMRGGGGDVIVLADFGDGVRQVVQAERVKADRATRSWVLAAAGGN